MLQRVAPVLKLPVSSRLCVECLLQINCMLFYFGSLDGYEQGFNNTTSFNSKNNLSLRWSIGF